MAKIGKGRLMRALCGEKPAKSSDTPEHAGRTRRQPWGECLSRANQTVTSSLRGRGVNEISTSSIAR
jgi:hypothetical protein